MTAPAGSATSPVGDTPAVERASDARVSALSAAEREELYALLVAHFEGVTPTQFASDLAEKDWILRIRHGDRLVGFTTLQVYRAAFEGRDVNVVYSGDTIMSPEAWGSPVLARAWIALVRRIQQEQRESVAVDQSMAHGHDEPLARTPTEDAPWYWLLLSSGFRTYRFLPVFWREFWPRHDAATPPEVERLMHHLAGARFGTLYEARAGVIRFPRPQWLRDTLLAVPEGKRRDPHVDFFLARNPGHVAGDELVCLASLGNDNLTAAGARMVRAGRR